MISRSWEDAGRKVQSRSQSGTVKKSGICWEDFAIGALVGIGAYMLLKALTEED